MSLGEVRLGPVASCLPQAGHTLGLPTARHSNQYPSRVRAGGRTGKRVSYLDVKEHSISFLA